jgi:hypothetical protein
LQQTQSADVNDLDFNFRKVGYTNETLARVRGRDMKRAHAKDNETYHKKFNRAKIQANYCTLQFYGSSNLTTKDLATSLEMTR